MTRTTSETLRAAADFVETLPPILRDSVAIRVHGDTCHANWQDATPEIARAAIAAFPAVHSDEDERAVDNEWADATSYFYRFDRRPDAAVTGWWVHLKRVEPAVVVTAASLLAEVRG